MAIVPTSIVCEYIKLCILEHPLYEPDVVEQSERGVVASMTSVSGCRDISNPVLGSSESPADLPPKEIPWSCPLSTQLSLLFDLPSPHPTIMKHTFNRRMSDLSTATPIVSNVPPPPDMERAVSTLSIDILDAEQAFPALTSTTTTAGSEGPVLDEMIGKLDVRLKGACILSILSASGLLVLALVQ